MIRSSGYSLLELMFVMAIMAILLLNVNLAGYGKAFENKTVDGVMNDIVAAVAMARRFAIMEDKMVTFCRSDDGKHCRGKWHDGSIIFLDQNADRKINGNDRLLFRQEAVGIEGDLSFNSFRNRQYLQLTPLGFTNYQNGNFTFCPWDKDPRMARQVIVSFSGRTRLARDDDGDGIVENSRGKPLSCK